MRDLWVVMEVVAILLPALVAPVAVAIVVAGAVRQSLRLMGAAASWIVLLAVAVVGPWIPHGTAAPAETGSVTVAVANVLYDNDEPAAAVADILRDAAPDVVVVPEATAAIDELLRQAFPYAERHADTVALGVYSRMPLRSEGHVPGLLPDRRQQRVIVDAPGRPFVLWGLHLARPWLTTSGSHQLRPGGHARKLDAFLDAFAEEELPVVIAGDLNLTDRGRGYRHLVDGRRDAMRGIWGGRTSVKAAWRPLLLRIDHIVVPSDWCAADQARFDVSGSDHRGVVARVGPCPAG